MDKPPPYNPSLSPQDVNVQVTQPHQGHVTQPQGYNMTQPQGYNMTQPQVHVTQPQVHVTQPQGHVTTVISNQPQTVVMQIAGGNVNMPRGVPRDWSTPLFGCFEDCGICLLGYFCAPCAACMLASNMDEPCCTPFCTGLLPMRAHFRGKHNIQGSIMSDCCTVTCCGLCAMCQMHRELNNMKTGRAAP